MEHVGFEPLLFLARELCYQLHHTPQDVIFVLCKTLLAPQINVVGEPFSLTYFTVFRKYHYLVFLNISKLSFRLSHAYCQNIVLRSNVTSPLVPYFGYVSVV